MVSLAVAKDGIRLRCLGVPELAHHDEPKSLTQQHARLLSVLVAVGPLGMEADGILEALWGEKLPKAGRQAVYSLVGRLDGRSDLIVNEAGRYRISNLVDVDAWRFDALVEKGDVSAQLEGIQLWRGRPFDGIEAGDVVAGEASRLLRKRIAATESVARHASRGQLREAEERILGATNDDPYNEPLVIAAASALYRLNKRRDALSILQSCRSRLRGDLGLGGSAELDAAELALLNDENPISSAASAGSAATAVRVDPLPLILAPRASLFVGRGDEMDQLGQVLSRALDPTGRGRVVVLQAGAGIGKSELVAQFANKHEGLNVRVGTNPAGSSAAYGSWIRAMPEASDALVQLSSASDPSAANLVFWRDVEHTIQGLASSAPLVLVLEDLHQSDPQSVLLFSWLASGSLPAKVLLLATTRPPEDGSALAAIINDLRERQDTEIATVIDIEALSLASIQQMVAARFPDQTPARTFRFASQVHALSQGNPLVSSALIKDYDEPTDLVTGAHLSIEEHHAQSVRGRVDSVVSGILTNAGLIGQEFDLEVVAAISEMTPSAALVHIETAMAAGLVVEADELGRFSFDHILTAEAFAQRASRLRRSQTYRALIEFDDLPAADRVRYIRGAFAEGDPDDTPLAAELLWVEAQKLARALSFSEARSACEHAVEFHRSVVADPGLELLILRAEVTARAGDLKQMELYRQEAFGAAAATGSADAMARAAMVGLPATERHEGDLALFELLDQIDADDITDGAMRGRFLHQYLRSARFFEKTDAVMDETKSISPDEIGGLEIWASLRNERLEVEQQLRPRIENLIEMDEMLAQLRASQTRTTVALRAMLFSIELMDDSMVRRIDRARAELLKHPVPRIQWAFELAESMLGLVGLLETPSTAETALATGFRLGVADAFTSFGAQSWHALWLEGRFDEAIALLEGAKGLIEPNVGWQAAEAFNLAAVGRVEEAVEVARQAVRELERQPAGLWSVPAGALLVEALSLLDGPAAWAQVAADVLAPHSGSAIVLGTGVAHLGPVDLYIGRALKITGQDSAADFADRGLEQSQGIGFIPWKRLA